MMWFKSVGDETPGSILYVFSGLLRLFGRLLLMQYYKYVFK